MGLSFPQTHNLQNVSLQNNCLDKICDDWHCNSFNNVESYNSRINIVCVCPGTFRNGEVSQKGRGVFLEQGGVLTTLRTMVLVLPYVKKKKKKKGECQCKILLFGLENY